MPVLCWDTANEELLRLVLQDPDIDVSAVFGWLRELPFMESGPRGIRPHDVVRQVLDADLRWRDPERHQLLRNRIPARTPVPVPAPMLVVPVPIPVPDAAAAAVSREEFNAGVRSALRAWHHPDRLATGPLARTSLVRALDDAVAAEQIRAVILEALQKLRADRYGERQYVAVQGTYLQSEARLQQTVADQLELPFGTYRRHLAQGIDRLCELLWHR